MAVRPDHRGAALAEGGGLEALAEAGLALGLAGSLYEAMGIVAAAAGRAADASVVVARVVDEAGRSLNACAVATDSAAVAAELEGSRLGLGDVPEHEESELELLPQPVSRAVERVQASAVLLIPVRVDGRIEGSLELMRHGADFDEGERRLARLAAGQAALVIRAFRNGVESGRVDPETVLTLAGEALAAGADDSRTADQVVRFAADATSALACFLWSRASGESLQLVASVGLIGDGPLESARAAAERALLGRRAASVETEAGLPGAATRSAALQLGQPPIGVLQLLFGPDGGPDDSELASLATFGGPA